VKGVGETIVSPWRRFVEPWVPQERQRREIPMLGASEKVPSNGAFLVTGNYNTGTSAIDMI
jgi:hypothetical protein